MQISTLDQEKPFQRGITNSRTEIKLETAVSLVIEKVPKGNKKTYSSLAYIMRTVACSQMVQLRICCNFVEHRNNSIHRRVMLWCWKIWRGKKILCCKAFCNSWSRSWWPKYFDDATAILCLIPILCDTRHRLDRESRWPMHSWSDHLEDARFVRSDPNEHFPALRCIAAWAHQST